MTRLGGDFAIIMLIGVDKEDSLRLNSALADLRDIRILTRETSRRGGLSLEEEEEDVVFRGKFSLQCPDQPGLVHMLMSCFKKHNLNIRSLKTEAGVVEEGNYFGMKGTFTAPGDVQVKQLDADLEELRGKFDVPTNFKLHVTFLPQKDKKLVEE